MTQYLVSVDGDPNDHGSGSLKSGGQSTIYVNGILAIVDGDSASADSLCIPILTPEHCAPDAIQGHETVFFEGIGVHAEDMKRACSAGTVVSGQTNVYVGEYTAMADFNVTTVEVDPYDPIPLSIALGDDVAPPYIRVPEPPNPFKGLF